MQNYSHAVGVSGTHGKTTTTGMISHALINAGLDPTISIGGELDLIGGNVHCGTGDYFVTEACEYTNMLSEIFPDSRAYHKYRRGPFGFLLRNRGNKAEL